MSNFDNIPDAALPPSPEDRVCQTCTFCTWAAGLKCLNPKTLGLEHDTLLEHGLGITAAWRLCLGNHWRDPDETSTFAPGTWQSVLAAEPSGEIACLKDELKNKC